MELHTAKEVKELTGEDQVNEHLALGWILINTRSDRDGDASWFVYLLAWPHALPAKTPPIGGI